MKKLFCVLLAMTVLLSLAVGGFLIFMNTEVSLDKILPQEQWMDVSVVAAVFEDGEVRHKAYMVEESVSGQLRQALYSGRAEHRRSFDSMNADLLWLVIWTGKDHGMWNLSLGENGLLLITSPDLHNYYFENCQELYRQMQNIVAGLPLTE